MQPCNGLKLYGYCDGYFGRDSYGEKRIEGYGSDWIVAREKYSEIPLMADFQSYNEMCKYLDDWSKPEEET